MRLAIALSLATLAMMGCGAPAEHAGGVRVAIKQSATRYTLPNGLEVVSIEDHRTPFVAVHLRYHAGSKDDPTGREGLAHLYEHMTFGGSKHVARDDVLPSLERLGARSYNGVTSRETTDYYETVPSGAFEAALFIEADGMRTAHETFDDALLAREKDVVENERKLNYDTASLGNVSSIVSEAFFPPGHPYRHMPIGTTDGVRGATLDDLRAFHDRHYAPDNATLAIVGDVDPAVARSLVEKYFGPAQPSKTHVDPRRVATMTAAATKRIRVDANVGYGAVRVTWPLPPHGQPGFYESWAALTLAAWTVDSKCVEKKIAHGVSSRFDAQRLVSVGEIRATLEPGASADAFVDVVASVMSMLSNLSSLRYLPSLRSDFIGGAVYAQESLGDRANRALFYDDAYADPNHVMSELKDVEAMSSSDVIKVYSSLLSVDRALVTVIVQNPQAPIAGRRAL